MKTATLHLLSSCYERLTKVQSRRHFVGQDCFSISLSCGSCLLIWRQYLDRDFTTQIFDCRTGNRHAVSTHFAPELAAALRQLPRVQTLLTELGRPIGS